MRNRSCTFAVRIATTFAAVITSFPAAEARAQILSAKRGFADVGADFNNLQVTNAGWYYTWGTNIGNPGNFDAKHYPMFWSGPTQSSVDNILTREPAYILGFNEPERTDQANMSVASAISSWTMISDKTKAYNTANGTNIKLVSPAVSDTSGGQAWMSSFMSQANASNLKVDAVAFHWYGVSTPDNPSGAASSFLSRVDSYRNQYQRDVFITEFAIHDWGGNYTDAQIAEANRQFLDIVIPALESRSYVAGYAWYHWFSDARLYEGNPPLPTAVGREYVNAINSGTTYNFSGVDLGYHVAYLNGGELTHNGAAGTLRYINALGNTSTISGATDWSNAGWVRVQPGATLRKAGSNQITVNGGTITNNGVIQVAAGELRFANDVAVSGSGNLRIDAGGTLSVEGGRDATSSTINYPISLRGGTLSTPLANGFFVANGTTISGNGTVVGKLTALSGSTVRVGDDGLSGPSRFVIDNFESYALGDVRSVASPPWTAHQNTSLADIENFSSNKVLTYGWANDFRGTSRDLADNAMIENGETATLFFRFNSKTDDPDHSFGLGDKADTNGVVFDDYKAQLRLIDNPSATGTFMLDARNGGVFSATLATGLATNSWYNVWMVVNQASDTYDLYMNTGTADATAANKLNTSPLNFRGGSMVAPLNKILGLAGPAPMDNGVRFDDLIYQSGTDLTNPMAGLVPGLVTNPATLSVQGDLIINGGARLELDIFDPATHDQLTVTGNLTAGGILEVALDPAAPALELGDTFDLFNFGTITGTFATLDLPPLEGLVWNTSQLYVNGTLSVALPGDLNFDMVVDAADYVLWRHKDSGNEAGNATWQANFGRPEGGGSSSESVPEPGTFTLLLICCWLLQGRVSRRSSQSV